MADAGTLHDAFIDELRDAYDAEKQLTKALPKMAKAASSPELRDAFEMHLEETRGQVERLEEVFASLDEKVRGKHCDGIAGIIEEGKAVMEEDFDDVTMDACLIAGAQRAAAPSGPSTTRWRLTARSSRGLGRWATRKPPSSCRRRSRRKKPPTRNCRRWRKAESIRTPLRPHIRKMKARGRRLSSLRSERTRRVADHLALLMAGPSGGGPATLFHQRLTLNTCFLAYDDLHRALLWK